MTEYGRVKNARDGKDVLAMELDFVMPALFGKVFSNFESSETFSDWLSWPQVIATRSDC